MFVRTGLKVLRKRSTLNFLNGLEKSISGHSKHPSSKTDGSYVKLLRMNWTALSTCFLMTYGDVRGNPYSPLNRRTVNRVSKWLLVASRMGLARAAKQLSHRLRSKALGLAAPGLSNRGKEPLALFSASTLSRGLRVASPSDEEIRAEVDAAIDRITEEHPPLPPGLLKSLDDYIAILFKGRSRAPDRSYILPFPSTKSCLQANRQQGGASTVLTDPQLFSDTLKREREEAEILDTLTKYLLPRNVPWVVLDQLESVPAALRAMRELLPEELRKNAINHLLESKQSIADYLKANYRQEIGLGRAPALTRRGLKRRQALTVARAEARTQDVIFRDALEAAAQLPIEQRTKVLPIIQADGKIRIATLHGRSTLWVARGLTATLLPHLRKLTMTRDMLRGKPTRLVAKASLCPKRLQLYSADLSKSTDPISIPLAKRVLYSIANHIYVPEWYHRAVDATIKPYWMNEIVDDSNWKTPLTFGGTRTTCGALMGLGPGWTVLCVLNGFAAWRAGASKGDHAICGDDLVGLWTQETCDRYEDNIRALGLVPNTTKSFRSKDAGVFCERLIRRTGPHEAFGREIVRISEAVAMRSTRESGRMSCDRLSALGKHDAHKIIRRVALRTARQNSPSAKTPGTIAQGGGGTGIKPDAITCIAYARYGPVQHYEYEVALTASKDLRRALRSEPCVPRDGVAAQDVIIQHKAEKELEYRARHGTAPERPGLLPGKFVRNQIHRRRAFAKRLTNENGGVIAAMRSVLSSDNCYVRTRPRLVKDVIHHLRRRNTVKAMQVLQRSWNILISRQRANKLLQDASPNYLQRVTTDLLPAPRGWESKNPVN